VSRIHPTAVVDAGAQLADGVEIGPWCIVGRGGPRRTRLASHVVISRTTVGARTVIHPSVIGGDPQQGLREPSGSRSAKRANCTFNRARPVTASDDHRRQLP
jgi:UDP-N-acetylglucosamine acyltransferase